MRAKRPYVERREKPNVNLDKLISSIPPRWESSMPLARVKEDLEGLENSLENFSERGHVSDP